MQKILKIIFPTLGGSLFLVVSICQAASYLELKSKTTSLFQEEVNISGNRNKSVPLYQHLSLYLDRLFLERGFFYLSGFGRLDLADRTVDYLNDGRAIRVNHVFFDWATKNNKLNVRLGRQFALEGVLLEHLDGLKMDYFIGKQLGVSFLGGSPVVTNSQHDLYNREGDYSLGSRVFFESKRFSLGASIIHAVEESEFNKDHTGLDLIYQPFDFIDIYSNLFFDIIAKQFFNYQLSSDISLLSNLKLNVDGQRIEPGAYLNKNSIFSVFSADRYTKAGMGIVWQINRILNLWPEGQLFYFEADNSLGYKVGAQVNTKFRDNDLISFGVNYYDNVDFDYSKTNIAEEVNSDRTELTSKLGLSLFDDLTFSNENYLYVFNHKVFNEILSYTIVGTVGYQFSKMLSLTGYLSFGRNPHFAEEIKGLVSLSYNFRKTF